LKYDTVNVKLFSLLFRIHRFAPIYQVATPNS